MIKPTRHFTSVLPSFLTLVMLLAGSQLFAQPDLPTEQVEVVKDFDARLLDTEKQPIPAELPRLDTTTKRQNYAVPSKSLTVEYLPPTIRPVAIKAQDYGPNYNGFAKLGAGYPNSILGQGFYNIQKEKTYDIGIGLNHHSANNSKNLNNQRFSRTGAKIGGNYYTEEGIAAGGYLAYDRNRADLYAYDSGIDLESVPPQDTLADRTQRFSMISAGAKVFNGERTVADFNYSAGFDLYSMNDNYAAKENGFDLKLEATKWFNDSHPLRLVLRTDFTSYNDTAKQTLHNFYLQPSFTYHGDIYRVKLGMNLVAHEDEYHFFPDVEASLNLFEGLIVAFAGAEGSLQKNTMRSLSTYNPYITSRLQLENTDYYNFFGGIKGTVQGISYSGQAGYKRVKNLALFLTDPSDITRFQVLYDTANIFYIKGSAAFNLIEDFELTGSVTQNIFDLGKGEKPWHLPSLEVNVTARYTGLENKLRVKAELYLENGVPVLPFTGSTAEPINLNALFDISVGAEYFFTENIGAFIDVNNLANNKRQRWYRYPTFGLNALVGVMARF